MFKEVSIHVSKLYNVKSEIPIINLKQKVLIKFMNQACFPKTPHPHFNHVTINHPLNFYLCSLIVSCILKIQRQIMSYF